MQSDDTQKKVAPVRVSKKAEGWREREEARNASVAPRKSETQSPIVRC
jgi:hypothetical protein